VRILAHEAGCNESEDTPEALPAIEKSAILSP